MARIPSLLLSPPQSVDGQDNLLVASPTVVFWKHNDHPAHFAKPCQWQQLEASPRASSEKMRKYGYDEVIRCDQQFLILNIKLMMLRVAFSSTLYLEAWRNSFMLKTLLFKYPEAFMFWGLVPEVFVKIENSKRRNTANNLKKYHEKAKWSRSSNMKIGKFGGRPLFSIKLVQWAVWIFDKSTDFGPRQSKEFQKRSLNDGLFFVDTIEWTTIH